MPARTAMSESRKFRFPFIELLSIATVVLASVIVLYPGADKFVVSLVTGKAPAEEFVHDYSNAADPMLPNVAASDETNEIRSLEQRSQDNDFVIPGTQSSVQSTPVSTDQTSPYFTAVLPELPVEPSQQDDAPMNTEFAEDQMVVEAPSDPVDARSEDSFADDQFVVGLQAPLTIESDDIPEAEFTSENDPAPNKIPTSQISSEMPFQQESMESNFESEMITIESEVDTNSDPTVDRETNDDFTQIRYLPLMDPNNLRVVEGSLTPTVSPNLQRLLPNGFHQSQSGQTVVKNNTRENPEDQSVAWKSAVVQNPHLHKNDLKPALKQITAPKIQTARLPEMPSRQPTVKPEPLQPFARGFIPEHVPGEKAKMMSQAMQDNNDFASGEVVALPVKNASPNSIPLSSDPKNFSPQSELNGNQPANPLR